MNIFDEGIEWFNQNRAAIAVEFVTLKTALVELVVVASVIEPETQVDGRGFKVETDTYVFLIEEAYLAGIDFKRGDHFYRTREPEILYEVISDTNVKDYNDPNNTTRAIKAQKRCYSAN